MKVVLKRLKNSKKKFSVSFQDGTVVKFGAQGYENYTTHGDPHRMRLYISRHGGIIHPRVKKETDPNKIDSLMTQVTRSKKENWGKKGIKTPGFWSRWLLWSKPDLNSAKLFITNKFNVQF